MLVWNLEASNSRDLSNQLASYLRRGFEVIQIVVNTNLIDKKPYKAFLINKKQLNIVDENLKKVEIPNELVKANLYEVECNVDKKHKFLLKTILYGNSTYLIEVGGKEIFFEFVLITDNKIILKNPIDNKTKKIIKINPKKLKKAICEIVKKG